jgi:hypothetical protein
MTDDEKAALADVYERAADYAETVGWQQHSAGEFGQPRCFIGLTASAVGEVRVGTWGWKLNNMPLWTKANEFASDALAVDGIIEWNDDPTRTKDEVINTLHALANKLR